MLGVGLGNGLISTSAGVLASRATAPEHRGEALSIYYVATASSLAVGPPLGFALYGAAGIRASLLVAAALVCVVGPLAWSLRERAAQPVPGARLGFTLVSRHALAIAGTMVLTNIGHSSVYAFLPLYAIAGGMGSGVGWFYTLYSAWLIACRVLLRRASRRLRSASSSLRSIWTHAPTTCTAMGLSASSTCCWGPSRSTSSRGRGTSSSG
jgi:predicted MFS family arabinose efflux permease